MNDILDNALEKTAAHMESEFETITPFRWNYYALMLTGMIFLSCLAVRISGNIEAAVETIRSTPHHATQTLHQLTDIVGKLSK